MRNTRNKRGLALLLCAAVLAAMLPTAALAEEGTGPFQINVQYLDEDDEVLWSGELSAEFSHTIQSLKEQLATAMGLPVEDQKLELNGNALEDGKTVADYSIHAGSTLILRHNAATAVFWPGGDESQAEDVTFPLVWKTLPEVGFKSYVLTLPEGLAPGIYDFTGLVLSGKGFYVTIDGQGNPLQGVSLRFGAGEKVLIICNLDLTTGNGEPALSTHLAYDSDGNPLNSCLLNCYGENRLVGGRAGLENVFLDVVRKDASVTVEGDTGMTTVHELKKSFSILLDGPLTLRGRTGPAWAAQIWGGFNYYTVSGAGSLTLEGATDGFYAKPIDWSVSGEIQTTDYANFKFNGPAVTATGLTGYGLNLGAKGELKIPTSGGSAVKLAGGMGGVLGKVNPDSDGPFTDPQVFPVGDPSAPPALDGVAAETTYLFPGGGTLAYDPDAHRAVLENVSLTAPLALPGGTALEFKGENTVSCAGPALTSAGAVTLSSASTGTLALTNTTGGSVAGAAGGFLAQTRGTGTYLHSSQNGAFPAGDAVALPDIMGEVTFSYKALPVGNDYALTAENTDYPGGMLDRNSITRFTAKPPKGCRFDHWEVDGKTIEASDGTVRVDGGTAQVEGDTLTVVIVGADMWVKAVCTPIPTTGGSSSSSTSTTTQKNDDGSTTSTTKKADGSVVETTKWPDGNTQEVTTAEKKQADGSKVKTETVVSKDKDGNVTASASATSDSKTGTVTVPSAVLDKVAKVPGSTLTVELPGAALVFDHDAIAAILAAGGKAPELVIAPVAFEDLPEKARGQLTEATTYGFSVNGDGVDFGDGKVSVTLDYTRKHPDTVVAVYYVSDAGDLTRMPGAVYEDGKVRFETDHWSVYAVVEEAFPFTDVTAEDWFYDAVAYVNGKGLMTGVTETAFRPEGGTTRATLAVILWRMAGSPKAEKGTGFTDAAPGAWYADAVSWCAEQGLMGGYGDGLFGPGDPITREQLVTALHRFAQSQGWDVSAGEDTNILSYTDAFDVSEWAVPAFQWACGAGVVQGDGGRLNPQGQASRAEVAVMLQRLLER